MTLNPVPPDDAQELADVRAFLSRLPAPSADAHARQTLSAALDDAWIERTMPRRMTPRWAWLIISAQVRLIHPSLWAGTALILALGTLVTGVVSQSGGAPLLAFLAPVVAAVGVALLYGDDTDPPLELQLATPVPPQAVLLGRLALLFGFNLALALGCSAFLALASGSFALLPLVQAWLAPMTLLSALAFLASVLLFDPAISALAALLLWGVLLWRQIGAATAPPALLIVPDVWSVSLQPALFVLAAAALIIGLWLAGRDERWAHLKG